jgi:hypothetical protein
MSPGRPCRRSIRSIEDPLDDTGLVYVFCYFTLTVERGFMLVVVLGAERFFCQSYIAAECVIITLLLLLSGRALIAIDVIAHVVCRMDIPRIGGCRVRDARSARVR